MQSIICTRIYFSMSELGRVRLFGDFSTQRQEDKNMEEHPEEDTKKCEDKESGEEDFVGHVPVIRRKRMYDEVDYDDSFEDPKLPLGREPRLEKKCCKESCTEGVDEVLKVGQEIKEEFVCESKLATRNKLLLHLIGQKKVGLMSDQFNWKGNFYCVKAFLSCQGYLHIHFRKYFMVIPRVSKFLCMETVDTQSFLRRPCGSKCGCGLFWRKIVKVHPIVKYKYLHTG